MSAKLHFRNYNTNQIILFPQRIDKDIAENDPVRLIGAIIDKLDLRNFKKLYNQRGRSPYHPVMMLKAIVYGYMCNLYSCRKIESALKRDINFIWLAGYEQPDFNTINRFRNRLKKEIDQIFAQLVIILVAKGFVSLDVEYIDGTKIESKANKYTFVWRKTTEKNRAKLMEKIKALLEQIDDSIAQENKLQELQQDFTPADLNNIAEELSRSLQKESEAKPVSKEEKQLHRERMKQIKDIKEKAEKLSEYDKKLETLGTRNSYSKTDKDATFMRMKEDVNTDAPSKPGYNLQIGTENQFITDYKIFQNPNDTLTMKPFFKSFLNRYGKLPQTGVADAGYGSEENYRYMEESNIVAYVKYPMFFREQRPNYKPNPFSPQSLFYNKEEDFYVCPMGQRLTRIGTIEKQTDSGYTTEKAQYRAQSCSGCPLRGNCHKGKGERVIEISHRFNQYKEKAKRRLTCKEGIEYSGKRCIEPESVFGQMKNNMSYRRFRHFGLDKVTMDFGFFAIAFNIKKMGAKMRKKG